MRERVTYRYETHFSANQWLGESVINECKNDRVKESVTYRERCQTSKCYILFTRTTMEMFEGMINDYDNTNVLTYKLGKTNVNKMINLYGNLWRSLLTG